MNNCCEDGFDSQFTGPQMEKVFFAIMNRVQNTIAAAQALTYEEMADIEVVIILGYLAKYDGLAGGTYHFDPDGIDPDNGNSVLRPANYAAHAKGNLRKI